MGIDLSKLDLGAISNSFDTRSNEISSQTKQIDGMFEIISSSIDGLDADFLDDKIFNGSSGNLLSKTSLSMDKILEMDEDEIQKLLDSADSQEEVEEALQKQKQLYSQQVKQFKTLQNEIATIEAELKGLITQVENAQNEQKQAAQNLEDAQKEEKTAQDKYEKAVKNQENLNAAAEKKAYNEAMEEYDSQDCPEEEMISFDKIYDEKLGGIDNSDSSVTNAKNKLSDISSDVSNAQKKYDSKTTTLKHLETNLTNVENNHKNKQNEVAILTTGITQTQSDITSLEAKAADIAFVEQNKEMIKDIAYNKNPEVIAAREASGVVFGKTESGKTNPCAINLEKMIDCNELNIAKQNNLDLDAVVEENGLYYPKYLISKGKNDGKYHIYERDQGNGRHAFSSIARLYASNEGIDIVANGNGFMNVDSHSDSPDSGFSECYYLTDDKDLKNCAFGVTYKNYCTSSPLSFDLNEDGVKTSFKIVDFDIDGDGFMDRINDSADAVLVFDNDGDGISGEDGSECFGDNTDIDGNNKKDGYKDGFEALKALAKKEGLIDGQNDNVLDENDIKFLEKTKGFKIKTKGYNSQAQSLLDLGISQINLAKTDKTTLIDDFDGRGNQIMHQEGATFIQDGKEKEYADIWHKKIKE